ncbi:MAG: hypothetical protein JW956_04530 [Calditrichaceae bacterium]|nr:hypothetical protein [Calditrichaceae bacterium]
MRFSNSVLLLIVLLLCSSVFAQETLINALEPFRPFLGKTFRGELAESTPEKPVVDISKWERALNGQAVRNLHSLNDGEYGGETIIYYDKDKQSLIYYYFTTAGFYTHGTMAFEGDTVISHEFVEGNENGITEVKSTATILEDGSLHNKSMYLKNGEWVEGHEATYIEAPDAELIFK